MRGTHTHTHTHTHTLRAEDGHYVIELVLLKVYMDHVACRNPLMHWNSRSQAHPDSITLLCWPKHILLYLCWLMDTMPSQGFHILVMLWDSFMICCTFIPLLAIGMMHFEVLEIVEQLYICLMLQIDLIMISGLEHSWIWSLLNISLKITMVRGEFNSIQLIFFENFHINFICTYAY